MVSFNTSRLADGESVDAAEQVESKQEFPAIAIALARMTQADRERAEQLLLQKELQRERGIR